MSDELKEVLVGRRAARQAPTRRWVPDPTDPDYPSSMVQLALEQLKTQGFPEAASTQASPFGLLDSFAGPDDIAVTRPYPAIGAKIRFNPERIQAFPPSDIADFMAHELMHVRQEQRLPWYARMGGYAPQLRLPYMERPWEKEAFDVMNRRRSKRRDYILPNPRP